MEIKTQAPVKVMYTKVKTTLQDIKQYVGKTPMEIKEECDRLGLTTNKIQHWVYKDVDNNPTKEFDLQISLQVDGEADTDKYQFQELPEFKCVTTIHKGPWEKFAATYEQIFANMQKEGIMPTNESREVYHTVDFDNPENNVTEIQIGVAV